MAEFKQGTEAEVKSGAAQYSVYGIVSEQSRTYIGRNIQETVSPSGNRIIRTGNEGTPIYHRAVTYVTQDDKGKVNGSERVIYIEKNGTWQPAAISKDGGQTYSFSDPKYPTMNGVAGAGFRNEINDPQGAVHKNLDAQVNESLRNSGVPVTQRKEVVESIRNNADQQPTTPTAAANNNNNNNNNNDNEEKPPQNIEDLKIEPEGRTNYEGTASKPLRYPEDLAETQQDYLKIRMVEFVPRKIQGGITPSRANAPTENQKVLSTIFLPITGGINDSNTVDWSKGDMDLAAGALAGFTFGAISQGVEGATNAANNTANDIEANIGGVKNAVANKITESLTGVNTLQRNFGAVLNQNTELLFNGPTLRQHSFTYKFSPRSNTEAKIVKKIIRTLKQGMSAKKANGFLFVKSPHTFFLSYHFKNQDHPYLNKFKQCALTSLAVNYTPDGNYATYHDGSMISYQVTMSFQELEPVFDSDYGDGYDNIGY